MTAVSLSLFIKRRAHALACVAALSTFAAGCAARGGGHFAFPEAPGEPAPEFAQRFEDATRACRDIRTLTAEAGLSGRVGRQKLRGRLQLGVGDPDAMRIEAVAPFGQPVFILAARDGAGTLLLPRDREVLREAPASDIVEALAGIPLSPSELRAVLTGCVSPSPTATGGQQYSARGLTAIALSDKSTVFVSTADGAPRIVAARRPGLTIEYSEHQNGLPRRVSLLRTESTIAASIVLALTQIETGVTLGAEAFRVDVPKDARPITLEQLRQAGPLGDRTSSSSKQN